MSKAKKENWFKKIFNSSWFFALTVLLLAVFSFALINEMARKVEIKKEIKSLEKQVKVLEDDNDKLSSLITYFKTEDYVIKEAKTKLGLKKIGEKVVAAPVNEEIVNDSVDYDDEIRNNWQLWRDYFFNK